MDKQTLRQYKSFKGELDHLDSLIEQLQQEGGRDRDLAERMSQRERIVSIMQGIDTFIDSIPDPVDKCLFRMVRDGLTYREIGDILYLDHTRVGRRMDRYLDC